MSRQYNLADQLISIIETGLRTSFKTPTIATRPNPACQTPEVEMTQEEKKKAAAFMRINHTGEVCAQALYESQSLFARDKALKDKLQQAAKEESDHLAWCEQRIQALDSKTSYLNPIWYATSFGIGAVFGLIGDKYNLGFLAETEKQVGIHLQKHLNELPVHDLKSRAIVTQMRQDESEHEQLAISLGAHPLPAPVQWGMQLLSKVMTKTTYYF